MFETNIRYLAGLACDGSEKSTCDQDVTERFACKNSSVDRTFSINSQDTDVDVNLDSELMIKDEIVSSKSMNIIDYELLLFCHSLIYISKYFFCSRFIDRTNDE